MGADRPTSVLPIAGRGSESLVATLTESRDILRGAIAFTAFSLCAVLAFLLIAALVGANCLLPADSKLLHSELLGVGALPGYGASVAAALLSALIYAARDYATHSA